MSSVLLGFEVDTGVRIEIPLAHTFVTGQTQLSGKTTTLRAIVERSHRRALAFVTKRGESFPGRRIQAYLPRRSKEPIHWRLVETILASTLGQRQMKYERLWLINAVRRPTPAHSLEDVRANVDAQLVKAKGNSLDVYTLIREYLDLVLPDMRELNSSNQLQLEPGLNVMDLSGVGLQLQSLVIRAALERINEHEKGVLTVFPEAWEFAPRAAAAPAKDAAIGMARKGAVLGNFLLCDSQDIAGVDTVVRQAASVWILGVQRELNELKRTIQMIPAGIKRPKPEDVAQLELGQFFACWGRHAVKVYVQPVGMSELTARAIAQGDRKLLEQFHAFDKAARAQPPAPAPHVESTPDPHRIPPSRLPGSDELEEQLRGFVGRGMAAQAAVTSAIADAMREDEMNAEQEKKLDALIGLVTKQVEVLGRLAGAIQSNGGKAGRTYGNELDLPPAGSAPPSTSVSKVERNRPAPEGLDPVVVSQLYQEFKRRLTEEILDDPQILEILVRQPELRVKVERQTIQVDGDTLRGRLALLISEGWFDEAKESGKAFAEITRRGFRTAHPNLSRELQELARMGFLTRSNKWYTAVPAMKANVVES